MNTSNSQSARAHILNALRSAKATAVHAPRVNEFYAQFGKKWTNDIEKIQHFANTMKNVNTQVIGVRAHDWQTALCRVIQQKKIHSLVLPMATDHGKIATAALQSAFSDQENLTLYSFDHALEAWKDTLFNEVEASFTDARCGIADTGSLVLWPDQDQPRSMSLVPPIHIVLFDATLLYSNFHEAMTALKMQENMPTNVLLISGPSKTADIQLTLAYGAHGPRELIVLACLPESIPLEILL